MLLARRALADHDARQPVLALQPHQEAAEAHDREDQAAGFVRHDLAPVGARRVGGRRGHDLEVLGAVGVGEDEELVAAFLDLVLQAGLARGDDLRLGRRVVRRQDAVFGRLVIVDDDEDPVVVARPADIHEHAGIGLLVDQPVRGRVRAETVVQELGRAVGGVEPGVEEAFAGRVPHAVAAGVGHRVGKVGPRAEVAHAQRVEFRALVVDAPQQLAVVEGVVDAADAEIGLVAGFQVAVEIDVLRPAIARRAEEARLLAALLVGRAVGIGPVLHRHGGIVLLDAALHLGEQNLPQLRRVGHQGRLVGVLVLQMLADRRIEHGRILEHVLPVVGAQPGELVDAGDAVAGVFDGAALGARRWHVRERALRHQAGSLAVECGMNGAVRRSSSNRD